ncbi:MAG: hypothetical protein NTV51_01365 [Verrucomicrobia bacterium]|nr:hypothetical protein [Verrucomicrobiota bacterium]
MTRLLARAVLPTITLAAAITLAGTAHAAILVFQNDLATFNATAGTPPVTITFDGSLSANIAGSKISGVTFSSPPGNTLAVVTGASTATPGGFGGTPNPATNVLIPTSGRNVLSPGGASLVPGDQLGERDSLQLDFDTPLAAFGLDLLFQSLDFLTLTSYSLFDANGVLLASGGVNGNSSGGGAPGDTRFLGFVSNSLATHFSRLVITESDGDNNFPDANIGYDTFRFVGRPATDVPVPSTLLLTGGMVALGLFARRRAGGADVTPLG